MKTPDIPGVCNGDVLRPVFAQNPAITKAVVFGSRAKGNHTERSDVDIALFGDVDFLGVERIAGTLDDLPFIQKFDVVAYNLVGNATLREHIDRIGIAIYERDT